MIACHSAGGEIAPGDAVDRCKKGEERLTDR